MSSTEDAVVRNRALQTEWYGEPLGDRFRRLLDRLGLSQSGLAGVLGLSAPMLSQLMSGQRAKISNPAVINRLLAVEELAADPGLDQWPPEEVAERLQRIRAETATTTSHVRLAGSAGSENGGAGPEAPARTREASPVRALQALLRSAASAGEIEEAAGLIEVSHPELAEILRVYGNGRTGDAEAHFQRTIGS
ncbi:helix-turn-helix domain-containing protein [Actinomadura rudentiformis]|uniref:XRE family transcriptional regulator n=1 Tax=Actinomadura rudentiformis TaxID=359158 RepID=A0A6H9YJN5_9ACTN|nr:helix-turn-helix transcriptional regulator [Actinomadura rudentiformis]KAB2341245.1 XRE family transcriptional regulator [Actinomadura rudentiformis]